MRLNIAIVNLGVCAVGLAAVIFAVSQEFQSGAAPGAAGGGNRPSGELSKQAGAASAYDFTKDVRPILETFCYDCHGDGESKGGLALDTWPDEAAALRDRQLWKEVRHHVAAKVMPPAKRKQQPSAAERSVITTWIDEEVFYVDCSKPDPGRVTIRRLNRQEYNNTIRDLVGVNFSPAADFPPDDTGYGFDNIGDVLSMSPVLLEKYLAAAEKIMDQAIRTESPTPLTRLFKAQELKGGVVGGSGRVLATNGKVLANFSARSAGDYTIRVRASADQAGAEPAKMGIVVGGRSRRICDVGNSPDMPKSFELKLALDRGEVELAAEFTNDFYDPGQKDPRRRDRNLHVESIEIEGPADFRGPPLPRFHQEWLPKDLTKIDRGTAARQILEKFASRAFRRPVRPDEVERLVEVGRRAGQGGGDFAFERGIKLAMVAVLVSPNFLFRNEIQPEPDNPAAVYRINEFALASRLSYFLWSTMPDEELFRHAGANTLRNNWDAQVARMLADPKIHALTENFAGQWLQLRDLAQVNPDRDRFREFDDGLREAMRRETELFFENIVAGDRSILEFLDADYTFANERLANHYGIAGVKGGEFRKVSLDAGRRGGVLTHGSVLTLTSNPTRTSPVKRGKWILNNFLGTPPPDPPANIPPLDNGGELRGTVRQKLEQHRADPNCAACHALMDPIGLALENFDGIGRWRDDEGGQVIDASGVLENGDQINGPSDLRRYLVEKMPAQFTRAMGEALLTYALGRGLDYYDRCAIDQITGKVVAGGHQFSDLVLEITRSVPFQMRRGDGERR